MAVEYQKRLRLSLVKMICILFVLFIEVIYCFNNQRNYHILILTSPVASRSHSIYLNGIAEELAGRGHQVTHRCVGELIRVDGVHNFVVKEHHPDDFMFNLMFEEDFVKRLQFVTFNMYRTFVADAINNTYSESLIVDLMKNPLDPITKNRKFDIVLIDGFMGEIYLPLVHRLGVPSIFISSTLPLSPISWNLNVPYYYFLNFLDVGESTNFFSRLKYFIFHTFTLCLFTQHIHLEMEKAIRSFLPKFPPLESLAKNISFLLTGNPPSFQDSIPTVPNVVDIGCVHCRPSKPLPQDLEMMMQQSNKHGVIYFSFGSIVKAKWVPERVMANIISALSQLPQTILWKGGKRTNASNFYFDDWFPQQDLFAHPNLRLVINNGGLGTVQESAYHGCPILGFPLTGDHYYSMKTATKNGFGEFLDWRTFTSDELLKTIKRMLNNKSYKESALKSSIRLKDRLENPSEQAAYWIEYVLRYNGAPFLKTQARYLSWHQYFFLDILIVLIFVLFIMFFIYKFSFKNKT